MSAAQKASFDPGLASSRELDAGAVLDLRRKIYGKGGVSRADVAELIAAGRAAGAGTSDDYAILLGEAATDLLVRQVDPPGYISASDADWLIAQLADGGGLTCKAEFSMLVDVLRYAVSAPASISAFAVAEVKKAILTGRRGAANPGERAAAIVTAEDVEALHNLVFAPTEGSSLHVTRESAEALFDIAHATAGANNDPGFDDLFAKAVGNYLLGIAFHWTPSAAEAREHEKWAERPASFAEFFAKSVEQPLAARFRGAMEETKSVPELEEADFARENASDAAEIASAERVDDSEAAWLTAHLTRDGELTSAEKRLMEFLAREATSMPASLRGLTPKQA